MHRSLALKFGKDEDIWPDICHRLLDKSKKYFIHEKSFLSAASAAANLIQSINREKKRHKHVGSILLMMAHLFCMRNKQDAGSVYIHGEDDPMASFWHLFGENNKLSIKNTFEQVTGVSWEALGIVVPPSPRLHSLWELCKNGLIGYQFEIVRHRHYDKCFIHVAVPAIGSLLLIPIDKTRVEAKTIYNHWGVGEWTKFFNENLFPMSAAINQTIKRVTLVVKTDFMTTKGKGSSSKGKEKENLVSTKKRAVKFAVGLKQATCINLHDKEEHVVMA